MSNKTKNRLSLRLSLADKRRLVESINTGMERAKNVSSVNINEVERIEIILRLASKILQGTDWNAHLAIDKELKRLEIVK